MSKNTNLSFLTDYITADITNGRIGINTPSPTVAFDVTGVAKFSSSVSATSLRSSAVGSFGFNTANNGEFQIYATAADGLVMAGRGSTNDFVLVNKTGSNVFEVPTGTINTYFRGNVGIGTSSPSGLLGLSSASRMLDLVYSAASNANGLRIDQQNAGGSNDPSFGLIYVINKGANPYMTLNNGTSNIFMVANSGNVGIGTSTPTDSIIGSGAFLDIASTGGGALKLHYTNATAAGELSFYKGSNGSYIDSAGAATLANNDLIFRTGGTVSNYGVTERMRITSGGSLCIGITTNIGSGLISMQGSSAVYNFLAIKDTFTGPFNDVWYAYFLNDSGARAGGIQHTASTTVSFVTSSDYRLKEDFKQIKGLETLAKIKPYNFKFKDEDFRMDGVIAHELQEILPYAVTGVKDGKDMQGVDYSKIVPVLVKAIQELKTEIDTLKNK